MKLDKTNCLGGYWNGKEIIGIKYGDYVIYPHVSDIPEGSTLYKPHEYKNNTTIETVNTFVTAQHTDLSDMFYGCTSLRTISNMGLWNTSNVTDMDEMFYKCSSLTTIAGIDKWDTSNVNDMTSMFSQCNKITKLNVNNFNTSNVTSMFRMFDECRNLTSLNVSNFDTRKVETMNGMFYYCCELTKLNLSNFYTDKIRGTGYGSMFAMFASCGNLTSLDIRNFNIAHLANYDVQSMFYYCNKLQELRLDNCSKDTINRIITSSGFPTNSISGVTRKIYVKQANVSGLTAPTNWVFVNCSTGMTIS